MLSHTIQHLHRMQDESLDAKDRARALFELLNDIDEPLLGEILMNLEGVDPQRYQALLEFASEFSELLDKAETTWGAKEDKKG